MMSSSNDTPTSRGFLPVLYNSLRRTKLLRPPQKQEDYPQLEGARIVEEETTLRNRSEVEQFLPDILGRALARSWIDNGFRLKFLDDPKDTLAHYGVFLPDTITIEIQTLGLSRPRVIVYEKKSPTAPKLRVVYLQLVMKAGR